MKRWIPIALLGLTACAPERPNETELFNQVSFVSAAPGASDIEARAISIIEGASTSCWIAAETFTSTAIADALISAQARGLDVRAIGDVDLRDQAGFRRLAESLQPVFGELPMRFGDGPLEYNPQLVDTVARAGDHNRMTHNFLVCDEQRVLTVTGGFGDGDVFQTGMDARSFYLGKDYADEFTQLYGGVFASTLSTFNGPLKSTTDHREFYDSDQGRVRVYFGPQERLMKRVIDSVYAARASVEVVTEELTSADLAAALRYKAEAGFEVRVVVARAGENVDSSRYAQLATWFRELDNATISLADDVAVNAVRINRQTSPIDGLDHPEMAMFLSQPLLAGTSVVEGQVTTARASDAFSDANMFVFERTVDEPQHAFGAIDRALDEVLEVAQ